MEVTILIFLLLSFIGFLCFGVMTYGAILLYKDKEATLFESMLYAFLPFLLFMVLHILLIFEIVNMTFCYKL